MDRHIQRGIGKTKLSGVKECLNEGVLLTEERPSLRVFSSACTPQTFLHFPALLVALLWFNNLLHVIGNLAAWPVKRYIWDFSYTKHLHR